MINKKLGSNYNGKSPAFRESTPFARFLAKLAMHIFMWLAVLMVIIPLLVVIIGSFKTNKEFFNTEVFTLPDKLNIANYKEAFIGGKVLLGLRNTLIIIVISCAGTIITGTMTAFVLQRFRTMLSRFIKAAFLLATLLPNISMQVTVFQIVNKMGLYDSMLAPIILYIGTDIISITIFIQFLNNISVSLDESAIVDGASYPRIYFSIILPNLLPAIATVLIIKFVGIYNDFYTAQLYMPSKKLGVVSTALYRFIGPYGAKWEIIFAGIVICIIPTLIMFLALQKYIYNGLVSGSVKE
jgi:multiple sugar transport system permease protein